jgi:uncharacterized protein YceH (UPF0502 family)
VVVVVMAAVLPWVVVMMMLLRGKQTRVELRVRKKGGEWKNENDKKEKQNQLSLF